MEIPVARLVTQTEITLPIIVVHGAQEGPRIWLSAAIHGDELNGTEIIRRVLQKVKARRLKGTILAAPVVNVFGFVNQSRYLPDRRDLNRSFPGARRGSLAGRLAHLFVSEVLDRCEYGIDLHTGSNNRINLPQIRARLEDTETRRCAEAFAAPLMIHGKSLPGSLRHTATQRGKTVLVYEAGEPLRFNRRSIAAGVSGVHSVIKELGMLPRPKRRREASSLEIKKTKWLRASRSGIIHMEVGLGDTVREGDIVAMMHNTFGDPVARVRSTINGIVIGLSTNPLLSRGEAAVHVGELPGL